MKVRAVLTGSALLASMLAVVVPSPVHAAAKQQVKIYLTGDCADGQMVEGVDEDDCEITVNVTPRSAKRSAVLEVAYDPDQPEWEELDSGSTKSGRLIFGVSSTDEDDIWMDGVVLYRVRVKKSGTNKAVVSSVYKTAYTSADAAADDESLMEDVSTVDEDEAAFNDKMDQAKQDNQKKINEQQPNQNIKQGTNSQPNNQQPNNQGNVPAQPPTQNERAGMIHKACGSVQIAAATCEKVIASKNGAEVIAALGGDAEKFCMAISKMPCKDFLPKMFNQG